MKTLEEIIQEYLNSIVYLSDRKLKIDQQTLHYLEQRIYSAYGPELGSSKVSMIVGEDRNISFTIYRGDFK